MSLPLAGGLGLMVFASRSLLSAAMLAPSASILDGLQHLRPASTAELARLAYDLKQSLAVQQTAASWSALGMVLALQAEVAPAPDRSVLVESATAALRSSLGMAPANPYVWARLALVREGAGDQAAEILRYLHMSWETGPNEERLRPTRIGLALRHWQDVPDSDRPALFEDIRNGWASAPEGILALVRTSADANVVRASLVTNLGQLASFEAALARTGH
jgi:hypothetical protein